jgi:hypothetical protein
VGGLFGWFWESPEVAARGGGGYTYHLQELAFFSWFYGAPSIGIHQWFSDNGTFLTDAGPMCQSASTGGGLIPPK